MKTINYDHLQLLISAMSDFLKNNLSLEKQKQLNLQIPIDLKIFLKDYYQINPELIIKILIAYQYSQVESIIIEINPSNKILISQNSNLQEIQELISKL